MQYELVSHVNISILQCVNNVNTQQTKTNWNVFSWQHFFHLSEHHNPKHTHMRRTWGKSEVWMDGDKCV